MNDDDNLQGWAHQEEILHQLWLLNFSTHLQETSTMSLTVKETGNDFLPPPEGLHIARCYAVIDMGLQHNKTYNNSSPKVLIAWELTDKLMDDGKPFIQMQRYTASLSSQSKPNLRAHLEAWRGKSFTAEELKGFKLKNILGVPCYLTTKHTVNPRTNKTWSEVSGICRLPNNTVCPAPINKPIYFDLDEFTEEAYLAVPEGIRKKINLNGMNDHEPSSQHADDENSDVPF